jgi:hypothetical protein
MVGPTGYRRCQMAEPHSVMRPSLRAQLGVAHRPRRRRPCLGLVVGGGGDLQHTADRLELPSQPTGLPAPVGVDESDHFFRRAQLLGLRWHNVYFDTGRVSFCAGWVEGLHGPVLTATKTNAAMSSISTPATVAVLADHAEHVGAERGGFVFIDDSGITAWEPNRVTKAFLRCRRSAGLRLFRLHDLSHFMATEMLHAGIPLVVVSRRLDHRRVSTTLDTYAHGVPGGDAQASATLRQS